MGQASAGTGACFLNKFLWDAHDISMTMTRRSL